MTVTAARKAVGRLGEDAAALWYESHGYQVVARNWRVREGELDIVAASNLVVVFCEVKTRSSNAFGSPFEAVTASKQARIRKLALLYLDANPQSRRSLRFDVAAVTPGRDGPNVEIIEAAF